MISLALPFPPAVNNLYANGARGRFKSERYENWLGEAWWSLEAQKPNKISGEFIASLTFGKPDNRKRDLDGLCKAPLDLLVKYGVIEDDSLAQKITLQWGDVDGCKIELEAA